MCEFSLVGCGVVAVLALVPALVPDPEILNPGPSSLVSPNLSLPYTNSSTPRKRMKKEPGAPPGSLDGKLPELPRALVRAGPAMRARACQTGCISIAIGGGGLYISS